MKLAAGSVPFPLLPLRPWWCHRHPPGVTAAGVPAGGLCSSLGTIKRKFGQEQPLVTVNVETSWSFAFSPYRENGSGSGR